MTDRNFTYERLVEFIEGWTTWGGDPHVYDLGGLVGIMAACLRNLAQHSDEIELDEWEDRFSNDELKTLFALATRLQTTSSTHERE